MTVLQLLTESVRRAAMYNRHDLAAPRVVLWPDGERLWNKVVPLVRDALPELLVLDGPGAHDRQGSSTWLRYQLAREADVVVRVVYLPGVSRQAFRGAAGFPDEAKHLYALQFQGEFWTQQSGKDWTPLAFLASEEGGLGLDLARDNDTLIALNEQLINVLETPVASLRGRKLEAADFHGLAAGDPIRMLLRWMGAPEDLKKSLKADEWAAFAAICKKTFGLDPDKDGVITAVEHLVAGRGVWDQVWERYAEAPASFHSVRKALDLAQRKDLLDVSSDRIPANNRGDEEDLRKGLLALVDLPRSKALETLKSLSSAHKSRSESVWAKLGEASLACAVSHLATMVAGIRSGSPPPDWQAIADAYTSRLWAVDASVWKGLAAIRDAQDFKAVTAGIRAVYAPWLEEFAESLGGLVSTYPNVSPADCQMFEPAPGTALLFVDGLRCDIGLELRRSVEARGCKTEFKTTWAPLPTVTGTGKPAWRPLADRLTGEEISDAFEPQIRAKRRPLKSQDFQALLLEVGWPFLPATEMGDPSGQAWTEAGSFDTCGHDQGAKLAWRIEDELNSVAGRIHELLRGGWKKVVVLTDHGWLLLPGSLPKADLPGHLTVSKWGRCALAQPGAQHGYREVSWFWGGQHSVILAPGISVFRQGLEYSHGGLSVQEALTPCLTVTLESGRESRDVRIASLKWVGQRLRVTLEGDFSGLTLDLRTKPADASSSILSEEQRQKVPDPSGEVTLLVDRDDLIGQAAVAVVVLAGQVISKQAVTVGGG